jgi:hypothetical protein
MQEPLLILTRDRAATRRVRARIIELRNDDTEAIAGLLRRLQPRLVVARSAGSLFADATNAAGLIQAAGAAILLLRPDS